MGLKELEEQSEVYVVVACTCFEHGIAHLRTPYLGERTSDRAVYSMSVSAVVSVWHWVISPPPTLEVEPKSYVGRIVLAVWKKMKISLC